MPLKCKQKYHEFPLITVVEGKRFRTHWFPRQQANNGTLQYANEVPE